MAAEIRIGTSGFSYKHWRGPFYPKDVDNSSMFSFYLSKGFDTVELNTTFYHLPSPQTVLSWRASAPKDFLFAVKGSRFITHMKKLKDPAESVHLFFERMKPLSPRMGPVVFQLPPNWKKNTERLDDFLAVLPRRRHRFAIELRDRTWLDDDVYKVLRKHNVAHCLYDLKGFESPIVFTADFTYARLHGPTASAYQGSYKGKRLAQWAARIESWRKELDAIYVYFDNDQAAHAVNDALDLKKLLGLQDRNQKSDI